MGGGSKQVVDIDATPTSASFVVKSSSGIEMGRGTGHQSVTLPRKNEYQIEVTAPGYQPRTLALTKGTNGWIWGNLVIGWIVGFGVDFATGSAYKLEPALVKISLDKSSDDSGNMLARVLLFDSQGRLIRTVPLELVPSR